MVYPMIYRVSIIQGGAAILPPTVCWMDFHHQMGVANDAPRFHNEVQTLQEEHDNISVVNPVAGKAIVGWGDAFENSENAARSDGWWMVRGDHVSLVFWSAQVLIARCQES